ncbi:MAG: hypothetical protein Q3M30_11300 [Candidatus Electrothrix sp. Rat3]|nr:hypothetical protein [Candidatus Electrothrix rattekaaiensis]
MIDDPLIEEIRRNRNEYAKQFNYNLDAICRDLEKKQKLSGRKVVSFPPKKPTVPPRSVPPG